MKTHLIIDADCLVYQAALGAQSPMPFQSDPHILHDVCDLRVAFDSFDILVQEFMEELGGDSFTLVLSGPGNWRKDVMPSYKGNRTGTRRPLAYKALRERCRDMGALMETNLEGDDLCGMLLTEPHDDRRILVSLDKDMYTLPGLFFRTNHGLKDSTPEQARRFHLIQTLAGDRVDGYPGCPGVGDKTAAKLLGSGGSWDTVVAAYTKKGLTEADALRNAQVAHIMQHGDYNYETQEVKLWTPN